MLVHDTTVDGVAKCLEQMERLVDSEREEIAARMLKGAMSVMLKAHLRRGLEGGRKIDLIDPSVVTPTEAATAACSLIAAFDLTPFDLAMWQTRMSHLSVGEKQ